MSEGIDALNKISDNMRNLRKKYTKPRKPWVTEQLEELKALKSEYGLSTTKEIFIAREKLRGFRRRARQLIALANEAEKKLLVDKLAKLGMLKPGAGLDDVLALDVKSILERRLQTLVFKRGMATSAKQARQLIVHGRVSVSGVRTKYPSYMVTAEEEALIGWFRGQPKKPEGPKGRKHAQRRPDSDVPETEATASVQEPAEIIEEPAAEAEAE